MPTVPRGPVLTDKRILQYILAGHYGEARKLAALANIKPKRVPRAIKPKTVSLAMQALRKATKSPSK